MSMKYHKISTINKFEFKRIVVARFKFYNNIVEMQLVRVSKDIYLEHCIKRTEINWRYFQSKVTSNNENFHYSTGQKITM